MVYTTKKTERQTDNRYKYDKQTEKTQHSGDTLQIVNQRYGKDENGSCNADIIVNTDRRLFHQIPVF